MRVLRGIAVAALAYTLLLVLLGWALEGVVEDRVRSRLEYMLRANDATAEHVDVSLLRGQITLRGLAAERSGIGTARLKVAKVGIDIAPMGLAIVVQEPKRIELVGAHRGLSAVGAATVQSGSKAPNISVD
ncbi:MAG: hypothetical protein GY811_03135, partial [Myxococcales bacterium]|nr:hypothetical protein [Myxococcales bacterium]